ncbi:unnamed protein product [Orchesella dallaii]|uniref:Uncharacterized protein n=1 Tax=Orchesella dallaii TaxID=48710 RepID=A0ABP1R6R4_9HEXA
MKTRGKIGKTTQQEDKKTVPSDPDAMSTSKAINLSSERSEQPAEIRKESLSPATNLPNVRPPNHDDITVRGYVNGTLKLLKSPVVSMPEVNATVAENTRSKTHERLVASQNTLNSCKLPKQELIVVLRDFQDL